MRPRNPPLFSTLRAAHDSHAEVFQSLSAAQRVDLQSLNHEGYTDRTDFHRLETGAAATSLNRSSASALDLW